MEIEYSPDMKEIARFGGGPAMEILDEMDEVTKKARAAGWTNIGVQLKDYAFVIVGIPPADKK